MSHHSDFEKLNALIFDPTILRAYDIRGTFGTTLSKEVAITLGRQFGAWLVEHDKESLAICYDGRISSPVLRDGLIEGLLSQGISITDIGLGPTPMLYFAVQHLDLDAGIMITGSHNPADDNGFKITLRHRPFYGDDIQDLNRVFDLPNLHPIDDDDIRKNIGHVSVSTAYINSLVHELSFKDTMLRIAIDCGNGATGEIITHLLRKLPPQIHVQLMYETIDGTFPNHHPDPAEPKYLKDLITRVKKEKLDLGIAFDGDGDRLGVIDRHGNIITGDKLTLFFAVAILKTHPGTVIMADVKSSQLVFEAIDASGGQPYMTPTGHSNFKALMPKHNALLGGEMSGHFFFKDRYYGFDDGIYAMLRLLELTSLGYDVGKFLSLLPQFKASAELKIACPDHKKFIIIDEIKKYLAAQKITFIDIDGVRVKLQNGWWLLRASNTSAYLIARFESYLEADYPLIKTNLESTLELFELYLPDEE